MTRGHARATPAALLTPVLAALGVCVGAAIGFAADAEHLAGSGARAHARPAAWGFTVNGSLGPLAPGLRTPLALRVTNRHTFPLSIRALTIELRVDDRHTAAGCVRHRDFTVSPVPRQALPVTIGPRRTRTLRALGLRREPAVTMRNLPLNQDGCKGARLSLRFAGRALRAPVDARRGR